MSKRNENRLGYKETKVGWIPEDWKILPAGEVFDIQLGKMLSEKARQGNNPQPYLANYNVKWGGFSLSEIQEMDFSEREMEKFQLKKGDLLVCEGGEVGRCAIWEEQINPCFYQKALHRVRPRIEDIDVSYTMYYIHFTSTSPRMVNYTAQTSISHFTREQFLKFLVALPPLSEQQKIAEILSTWDAAIEQTRKLIDAKKHRKKALMQQLLTGKKRLPGFAKTKGRNSYRFFDLPTDWKCPRIREVAEESSERNRQRDKLTVLSCSKHLGFVESSEYFGKQIFSEDTSNYKVIRRGCFGYPSNHIEEGSIGLLINHKIGMVSPIYTVFLCNENVVPEFLFALFKSDTYRHIFSISTNASVDRRGSLRWREFSLIQVPNPSKEEQHVIVDVLQTADDEINQVKAKLKALEKQKRGLMQKLLTGEVRVK
jgi:type I restriction enzyme S subunit